jgi:hypothetical protein
MEQEALHGNLHNQEVLHGNLQNHHCLDKVLQGMAHHIRNLEPELEEENPGKELEPPRVPVSQAQALVVE